MITRHRTILKQQNGFSLISAMVAAGITLIVLAATSSLLTSAMRETNYLERKLTVLELEKHLIATMADGGVCTRAATENSFVFDKTTAATAIIDIPNLKASDDATAPVLIAKDTLYGNGTDLKIVSIVLQDIQPMGNINTTDKYSANMVITVDTSDWVRSIKPIKIQQVLAVENFPVPSVNTDNKKIVKCNLQGTGSAVRQGGQPCTSPNFPNNKGVTMWEPAVQFGAPSMGWYCCGNGSGSGFNNAPYNSTTVFCDWYP